MCLQDYSIAQKNLALQFCLRHPYVILTNIEKILTAGPGLQSTPLQSLRHPSNLQ